MREIMERKQKSLRLIQREVIYKSPGLGLEPRLNAPEALVLPLHHPGKIRFIHAFKKSVFYYINILAFLRKN